MKTNSFAWSYAKKFKRDFFIALFLAAVAVVFGLILPHITQMFIDSVFDYSQTSPHKISPIWFWIVKLFGDVSYQGLIVVLCVSFVLVAFVKNICEFGKTQNLFNCASSACGHMRGDCFRKLAHLNNYTHKNETYVHFTNDISDFYDLITKTYPRIFVASLTVLLALIFIFILDFRIGLALSLLIPIIVVVGLLNLKKIGKNFSEIREKKSKMQEIAEEAVAEIREIKLFNREGYAKEKYATANETHKKLSLKAFNHYNRTIFFVDLVKAFGFAFALVMSALACFNGTISVGYFVLISAYSIIALNAATMFVIAFLDGQQQLTRINKVRKFLSLRSEFKDGKQIVNSPTPNLELINVSAVLGGRRIFNALSINMPFGKSYGIFLSQGEGKSALAKLLLKFFEADNGGLLIADIDYQNADVYSLRKHFSYVSQEPYIFESSLLANIIMFEDLNEEKLQKAIEVCDLDKLIKKYSNGLQHVFTEKGAGISSQDKQKINFARAVYKNAPILLIDSSFNKFTPENSKQLINNLLAFYAGRTVIILSERMVDMEKCDDVIFIENGNVRQRGTLEALKNDKYNKFYRHYVIKSLKEREKMRERMKTKLNKYMQFNSGFGAENSEKKQFVVGRAKSPAQCAIIYHKFHQKGQHINKSARTMVDVEIKESPGMQRSTSICNTNIVGENVGKEKAQERTNKLIVVAENESNLNQKNDKLVKFKEECAFSNLKDAASPPEKKCSEIYYENPVTNVENSKDLLGKKNNNDLEKYVQSNKTSLNENQQILKQELFLDSKNIPVFRGRQKSTILFGNFLKSRRKSCLNAQAILKSSIWDFGDLTYKSNKIVETSLNKETFPIKIIYKRGRPRNLVYVLEIAPSVNLIFPKQSIIKKLPKINYVPKLISWFLVVNKGINLIDFSAHGKNLNLCLKHNILKAAANLHDLNFSINIYENFIRINNVVQINANYFSAIEILREEDNVIDFCIKYKRDFETILKNEIPNAACACFWQTNSCIMASRLKNIKGMFSSAMFGEPNIKKRGRKKFQRQPETLNKQIEIIDCVRAPRAIPNPNRKKQQSQIASEVPAALKTSPVRTNKSIRKYSRKRVEFDKTDFENTAISRMKDNNGRVRK